MDWILLWMAPSACPRMILCNYSRSSIDWSCHPHPLITLQRTIVLYKRCTQSTRSQLTENRLVGFLMFWVEVLLWTKRSSDGRCQVQPLLVWPWSGQAGTSSPVAPLLSGPFSERTLKPSYNAIVSFWMGVVPHIWCVLSSAGLYRSSLWWAWYPGR